MVKIKDENVGPKGILWESLRGNNFFDLKYFENSQCSVLDGSCFFCFRAPFVRFNKCRKCHDLWKKGTKLNLFCFAKKKKRQLGPKFTIKHIGSGEIHPKDSMGVTRVCTGLRQSWFLSRAKFKRVLSPSRREEREQWGVLVIAPRSLKGVDRDPSSIQE